uniref:Major facilitator superfamily (MFS) profile domain-containing protein n=1 Tax=Clastoptera arizonana TaxID=38151 RepID=A0A1B6DPH3_9HEMI
MTNTCEEQANSDSHKPDGAEPLMKNGKHGKDALGDQTVTTYVTVPPDGGWGWVIVAASFCCNFFVDGIVYTSGVFLDHIAKEFNQEPASVAFVGSLLSGFYLIAGPFVSALANRYGFRRVTISGAVFASLSFVGASFAPSIEILCLTYGILGGIGFGLIYVPAVITVGFYFEKWRALATGISVCGSGIGTMLLAPFTTKCIEYFGWRGAILVQAGLIFTCTIFGALFRPLKPISVTVQTSDEEEPTPETKLEIENEEEEEEAKNKIPLLMRIKLAREELKRVDSTISFDNEVSITAEAPKTIHGFLRATHNRKYPTAREVLNFTNNMKEIMNSDYSVHLSPQKTKNKGRFDVTTYKEKRKSNPDSMKPGLKLPKITIDDGVVSDNPDDALLSRRLYEDTFFLKRQNMRRLSAAAAILEASALRRNSISLRYHSRPRTTSQGSHHSGQRSRRNTMSKVEAGVRPLYRDDIFLQGSLSRLDKFTTHANTLDYTMSVTRLPTWNDVLEEEQNTCSLCPEAVQRTLATMLDISLLQSPTFLLLCISGFITMMGFFVPFMFLQSRAVKGGMDNSTAQWLISVIGITNTVGRIGCGIITSLPQIDALTITNIALTVGGLATIFSGVSLSVNYQFAYAAIFGFAISCFASLRSILIVDLVGLEKLTNGFGLLLLFQGVAAAIGSPLAGYFMILTNSHNASFYLSGGLILISGIMCYPLNKINAWETKRNARLADEKNPETA